MKKKQDIQRVYLFIYKNMLKLDVSFFYLSIFFLNH